MQLLEKMLWALAQKNQQFDYTLTIKKKLLKKYKFINTQITLDVLDLKTKEKTQIWGCTTDIIRAMSQLMTKPYIARNIAENLTKQREERKIKKDEKSKNRGNEN